MTNKEKYESKVDTVDVNVENGNRYAITFFKFMGNVFSYLKVSGKNNYISIRKETNNPFRTAGRIFDTVDDAVRGYTSAKMAVAIIQADMMVSEQ